ncbi:PREDICTED: uncharacterized protein LOC104799754 isoform X2 [Tarenaya hassleriana]|uniref:uncharacterized protein LOC104799754 isoform X2 n=1 Tax=Tarenaya hassleriana TaxID=28532 RepID=UPI00053C980E|nr:PREDICTED: uncharacterized protein LOC104799754 isoform X2 [Tarenaya hassleriana]
MAFAVTAKLFSAAAGSIVSPARSNRSPKRPCFFSVHRTKPWVGLAENWGRRETTPPPLAANGGVGTPEEEGVSLGTMKLPLDTDLARFETLLFQWANSLCQGANLPLPVPLKVDKITGGARLGFITILDQGTTDVPVYIDCTVYQSTGPGSGPMFRATRNGRQKDKAPPGEERIMRSLLSALKKSIEIARIK